MLIIAESDRHADKYDPGQADKSCLVLPCYRRIKYETADNRISDEDRQENKQRYGDRRCDLIQHYADFLKCFQCYFSPIFLTCVRAGKKLRGTDTYVDGLVTESSQIRIDL